MDILIVVFAGILIWLFASAAIDAFCAHLERYERPQDEMIKPGEDNEWGMAIPSTHQQLGGSDDE